MVDRSQIVTFHIRGVEVQIPEGVDALNIYWGDPPTRIGEVRRCACGEHAVWIPDLSYANKWGMYV